MSYFDWGAVPITSTAGQVTDGSTSALFAELDSSNGLSTRGGIYGVNVWAGASTVTEWWLEHCLSTGLGSTAIRERLILRTATGQTSQFVTKFKLEAGADRLRVRVAAAHSGGNTGEVRLKAEELR